MKTFRFVLCSENDIQACSIKWCSTSSKLSYSYVSSLVETLLLHDFLKALSTYACLRTYPKVTSRKTYLVIIVDTDTRFPPGASGGLTSGFCDAIDHG